MLGCPLLCCLGRPLGAHQVQAVTSQRLHMALTRLTMPCSLCAAQWVRLPPGVPKEAVTSQRLHMAPTRFTMPCSLCAAQWVRLPPGVPKEAVTP